jgi:hypothetical protein
VANSNISSCVSAQKKTVDTGSQLWLRFCGRHLPVCASSPETGTAPYLDGRMDFNPPFRERSGDSSAHIFERILERGLHQNPGHPARLTILRRKWPHIRRWKPPPVTSPICPRPNCKQPHRYERGTSVITLSVNRLSRWCELLSRLVAPTAIQAGAGCLLLGDATDPADSATDPP